MKENWSWIWIWVALVRVFIFIFHLQDIQKCMYIYERYGKAVSSLQNAHLLLYENALSIIYFYFSLVAYCFFAMLEKISSHPFFCYLHRTLDHIVRFQQKLNETGKSINNYDWKDFFFWDVVAVSSIPSFHFIWVEIRSLYEMRNLYV